MCETCPQDINSSLKELIYLCEEITWNDKFIVTLVRKDLR